MCAERVAVFKAVSKGEREFEAIAVVTSNGGTPCGSCRQVLAEFGLDTLVLIADENGQIVHGNHRSRPAAWRLYPQGSDRASWIETRRHLKACHAVQHTLRVEAVVLRHS